MPSKASVPIAVHTCASKARWTASFKAREPTDAENAVPFRILRCSLETSEMGLRPCAVRALAEETIFRGPSWRVGPSNTRMEGLPTSVPAIYDKGIRSIENKVFRAHA